MVAAMNALRQIAVFVVISASVAGAAATAPTVKPEDLPRVPPTEPKDAVKTFKVRPGFHVELAAAEPNVIDPIAMCFDADGRMFVVEMRDYSERRAEKLGRIRMLEDRDGDGVYETSTVFLDHLPWPTAVMCVNGGVLVGACPDIIFAKDTNGDGVADETKILFTGFGTDEELNVQGLFNNFIWGLDDRIHGCSGHDGGMVKQALHPGAPPLDVRNKGFVIDPRNWSMTTEAGGGQYGLSFDHLGRLFTCENSSHCEFFMYDARYAARNPYITLPDPLISIAADGPAAEVFRVSPEEPWRVIRTRWRVAGLVGGPVEGGGRSAGYFTGATGITVYRGDAFGPDYVGDAFIGDAGGNLVHHKRIRTGPDGITPVAQRPDDEKKIEFCASTDNWFRPCDFANTPDGTLYIADMYREVIEHPWSLPPQIKQYLDLNSGNDRGRVYRLAPDGFKPRPPPHLSNATTADLVELLEHPNGWHRETASRLLFERQDKSAAPLLAEMLEKSPSPLARMTALHVLDGLGGLEQSQVLTALADDDPAVREHAALLSEKFPPSQELSQKLESAANDPSPRVRYQLAFSTAAVKPSAQAALLAALARRDGENPWMRCAILSSCKDAAAELFERLADSSSPLLPPLATMIGAKGDAQEIKRVSHVVSAATRPSQRLALARALAEGAGPKIADQFQPVIDQAKAMAFDPNAPTNDRVAAISLLGSTGHADELPPLLQQRSQSVQLAALAAMDRANSPVLTDASLSHFQTLSPRVQEEVIAVLIKRSDAAKALLTQVQQQRIAPSALSASQAAFLRNHKDPALKALAAEVLPPPATRESVVAAFRPALDLKGDAARGHAVYAQRCISCHRTSGSATEGFAIGPDFVTVKNAGREKLLFNILDPNREVAQQYVAYLIETKDGQDVLGILASDTPASVTVRQAYGKEAVIQRANIKRMTSQGKSLMPEGLEVGMKPQDLADLMAFVESAK